MATKIITIANQKGGVGKTTTAIHLAHGLARAGKESLLIDFDPQGQCATGLGMRQERGVFNMLVNDDPPEELIRSTGRDRLWLLPGNKDTAAAQILMAAQSKPVNQVYKQLTPLMRHSKLTDSKSGLRYIIFDTAPSVGGLQERALWAADMVLIPSATDFLSLEGVGLIMDTLKTLKEEHGWGGALLGLLPTFYDTITRESQATMAEMQRVFGERLIQPIYRATILRECAAEGKTIFEVNDAHRAAGQYQQVIRKILEVS